MKFGEWLVGESGVLLVSVKKLYGWGEKAESAYREVLEGKLSYSGDAPIRVSRLDSPRGSFFIIDGYHRAIEAIRAGLGTVSVVVDEYVPRIERTGGAFKTKVDEKVPMTKYAN